MSASTPAPPTAPERPARRRTRRLRDQVALGWLAAAVVISLVHRWVPDATWLMIHLVLLGALTHSAMVWSEHFAHTLLRTLPDEAGRRIQDVRILLLALGGLLVFIGVPLAQWWVALSGVVVVSVAVLWHAVHLARVLRKALPNRFRVVTHSYIAAALCLPVGAGFGAALALGLPQEWHGRLLVAHLAMNFLGWIGLTVTGTLVTFWPTMLRTRMDDRAETLARQALPIQVVGLLVVVAGALLGWQPLGLAGLVVYVLALVWWGRALLRPLTAKGLREFAPASVLAALLWGAGGLVWLGALLVLAPSFGALVDVFPLVGGVLAVGFAAQLLSGALSYLIPSVIGGGPAVVRAGQAWFDRWAAWRLVVINVGLAAWLLPAPSWVKVVLSSLVLAALVVFLPLLVLGARASARAKVAVLQQRGTEVLSGEPSGTAPMPHGEKAPHGGRPAAPAGRAAAAAQAEKKMWTGNQVVAAVAALLLAVTVGVGIDPNAAGLATQAIAARTTGAEPTGNTTRVAIKAVGMTFEPNRIEVPAGDRLVVELTNTDETMAHDLVIGTARTPRLAPGTVAELDAGVVTASTQGWCSVAGHRQMGMVLDIVVLGGAAAEPAAGGAGGHAGHAPAGTGVGHAGEIPPVNPGEALSTYVDPVLPALTDETVHHVTFTVTEVPLEVAPGLWQTRWTFNGGSVGPVLHGRVGDVFEITLVNDGTIGHSIDFHAGALAPDRPMRTIAPGESLVYRFTATRAGIWMYHCSTMPMSSHIGAGMHGAVVIEPEGLPEVDHSFVLVQSEVFLSNAATSADDALELDADKVVAEKPDRVVFNGIANQYDLHPFEVKVGERVRFWVLAAGPNRASSFHIVGGQFDTSWTEGSYTLRQGEGAFGATDGGAQVLPLLPAQGGFVELTFPEAGNYPLVNHVMIDAERGAHGIVKVTD